MAKKNIRRNILNMYVLNVEYAINADKMTLTTGLTMGNPQSPSIVTDITPYSISMRKNSTQGAISVMETSGKEGLSVYPNLNVTNRLTFGQLG